jgi:DNA invertase Pin-like site-specific DNA recombinase
LAKVMKALQPGDAVVVTKLDRVARSSRDLHNILGKLKDLGCRFVSLGEGWCDTTTSVGRLVISIMAGIAEFERERSASGARTASTERRPRARGSAASRCSTPDSAESWLSVMQPVRPWRSWHWNMSAAKRRSGERCMR